MKNLPQNHAHLISINASGGDPRLPLFVGHDLADDIRYNLGLYAHMLALEVIDNRTDEMLSIVCAASRDTTSS